VCEEGTEGNEAYLILSGEVEVTQGVGAATRQVRHLGPGELIGELAILGNGVRTATVRSLGQVRLLVIERERLLALLTQSPDLALCLLRKQTERLAQAEAELQRLRLAAGALKSRSR